MKNVPINRKDKLIQEKRHDAHPARGSKSDPTECKICGAVYRKGRWTWEQAEEEVNKTVCPACRRIKSNFPAGRILIKGPFYAEHKDEIHNLIDNVEKQEKATYPLERVMDIEDRPEGTLIRTTGIHIARRIGDSLSRAYQGELIIQYADGEKKVRITWER